MSAILENLEFITKPGCHLCDDAWPLVADAAARAGRTIVQRSVLDDDELMAAYGLRIPVVLDNGVVIAEGIITAADLDGIRE